MSDLNRATIIGNVTRPPELRNTTTGKTVCNFSVATNEGEGPNGKRVTYHSIIVWDKLAEICNQYLRKGSKVFVEGRMQYREWQAQDGSKRNATEIVATQVIFNESKINPSPVVDDDALRNAGLL